MPTIARHAACALASLLVVPACLAVTLNTAQVGVTPSFSGGTGPYDETTNANGPAHAGGAATGGFSSSGSASADVGWGWIKLSGDSAGSLNSLARGIFRDSITITAPGHATGSPGLLSFTLLVNGSLSVNQEHVADAGWSLAADVGGAAFDLHAGAMLYNNAPVLAKHGYVGDPFGSYSATVSFSYGIAMPVDVELEAIAQSAYSSSGTQTLAISSFDLAHSLYWGGLSVLDGNGQPLPSWQLLSASGTDYRQSFAPAVPEPAALLLWAAGLTLLPLLQRRAQTSAEAIMPRPSTPTPHTRVRR